MIFQGSVDDLDDLESAGINDFYYYDCGNKKAKHHGAEKVREHVEKLYQKPTGDILVALFRRIDLLTETSANALLKLFEDVPNQLLIMVTSSSPQKIIPTLQSRMIIMSPGIIPGATNPHQSAIDAYVQGNPEFLFALTLAPSKESKFSREDALWVIRGLQDAIECGTLSTRYAKQLSEAQVLLETTNTIAKYLIDQLLISLACE